MKIKTRRQTPVYLGVQILVKSRVIIPVYILQPSEAININNGKEVSKHREKMLSGANSIIDPLSELVCCALASFLGRTVSICPWPPMKSGRPNIIPGFLCGIQQAFTYVYTEIYTDLNRCSVLLSNAS